MRDSCLDLETHVVLHLFLDASPVSHDQDYVNNHEHDNDPNEHLGRDNVGFRRSRSNLDVLGSIVVKADLRLLDKVGTDVFEDVLGRDVASESYVVHCYHWPVHSA